MNNRLFSIYSRYFHSKINIPIVRLYTKDNCSLCIPVKQLISEVKQEYNFQYIEVDITDKNNKKAYNLYKYDIPVISVNDIEIARHSLSKEQLINSLLDKK